MKNIKRITAALLLMISLVVTALPFSAEVSAETLVYSTSSNSGVRHIACTTLDGTSADKYYTGSYTYENLEKLSSSALFDALQDLMTDTHKKMSSYDDCRDMAFKTDCENNDERINLFYSSKSVTLADYKNGTGWNRGYVWPKSKGGDNTSGGGADLHHIRPSDNRLSTLRGNLKYGNVIGGTAATGSALVGSAFVGGYRNDTYFEPLDNVKGDVARICLYMYVRWKDGWSCTNITKVFESVDVLLTWCEMDPVDTWEMGRNEVVSAYQGNRNVFIDYPELAWLIFDRDVPEGITTPSGNATPSDPSCVHTTTEIRNASAANCGENGYTGDTYCVSCGKKVLSGTEITASGNHNYEGWEKSGIHHWQECTVCKKQSVSESHSYDNACDTACDICGYTRAITHSYKTTWENDETRHWHICSVCGVSETKLDHVYYHACDTNCNFCGYVRKTAHSYKTVWSSDETGHWHPCSVCGLADEKVSHEFENSQDIICDICGYRCQVVTAPAKTSKPTATTPETTSLSTTPSTAAPSTTPDTTTSLSTTKSGETVPDVTGGYKNNSVNDDKKFIVGCIFSALGGALLSAAAVTVIFRKKS